jgi:hypothetical protein
MVMLPIEVFATFLNKGVQERKGVPLNVQIREASGQLMFHRDTVLEIIGAQESVEVHFGRFIPLNRGGYYVTFWSDDPDDPQPANDSLLLSFVVAGTSGVADEGENRGVKMLSVHPTVANDVVDVRYRLGFPTVGSIIMYDDRGTPLHEVYEGSLVQEGTIPVDVRGLPSGAYMLLLKTTSGTIMVRRVMIVR